MVESKQTFQELVAENVGYLVWLATEMKGHNVSDYLSHLQKVAETLPDVGSEVKIDLVHVGEKSIRFWPYTCEAKYGESVDPINILFSKNGQSDSVAAHLKFRNWKDSALAFNKVNIPWICASTQWVLLDDGNGALEYHKMDHSLSPQGCSRDRLHLRLFSGGNDSKGFRKWSVGAAHNERIGYFGAHRITDWDRAEYEVRELFSSISSCYEFQLQEREAIQGIWHDGKASLIEVN